MKNIVILVSGRGSNMESLVRACAREAWPARVACVVSNRPEAAALQRAQELGLATAVVDHRRYAAREEFDAALMQAIDAHAPAWVLLAGFMRILGDAFVHHYEGRMLNIHPSLLPSFPGLNTHERAIHEGVKVHGATVHFVTPKLDHGAIVAQASVAVLPGDDAAQLAERVQTAEHRLYPLAAGWAVRGELRVQGQQVRVQGDPPQWIS